MELSWNDTEVRYSSNMLSSKGPSLVMLVLMKYGSVSIEESDGSSVIPAFCYFSSGNYHLYRKWYEVNKKFSLCDKTCGT